ASPYGHSAPPPTSRRRVGRTSTAKTGAGIRGSGCRGILSRRRSRRRPMRILTVNTGSSSIKLRVIAAGAEPAAAADLASPGPDVAAADLREVLDHLGPADAVGHRFVHGGVRLTEPVLVDDGVRDELARLVPLAPLHQPKALAALRAVAELRPGPPAA